MIPKSGHRFSDKIMLKQNREAERRQAHHPLSAPHSQMLPSESASGAEAHPAGCARLSALHRGSRLGDRTPPHSLGPRFLESPGANGCHPSPGQCSELLTDRSSCRPGGAPKPPGSGLRDRARAPHSLHRQDRIRTVPCDERDVWACNLNGDDCQALVTDAVTTTAERTSGSAFTPSWSRRESGAGRDGRSAPARSPRR
jgi:hypothetical protein